MTNYLAYSSNLDQAAMDSTLIKIFLNTVKDGNLSIIKADIEKYNFDVRHIKDSQYSQNALFYAALIKDDREALNVIRYLVEEIKIDPTEVDRINQTSIYYAAREGKYLVCDYLISKGVEINKPDYYLQTPLYYASREGKMEIVKLLIEKGADVNLEDKYGQTSIYYAIKDDHYDVVDYITSLPQFTKLDKPDKKNLTPYFFALKNSKISIAELLANKGANTQSKSKDKKSKGKKKKEDEKQDEDLQKPKRYILVRINENGEKISLTSEELDQFLKDYPYISSLLNNSDELSELEENASEELKNVDSWEKVAKKIMNSICKFKDSEIFLRPVNPMELGIPDYFDIIKNPMDFGTIKKKLNSYSYRNCKEFTEDVELVFENCVIYNGEKSVIGALCTNVKNEWKKLKDQNNLSCFLDNSIN